MSQYVLIICGTRPVLARVISGGFALCPCGERVRVAT